MPAIHERQRDAIRPDEYVDWTKLRAGDLVTVRGVLGHTVGHGVVIQIKDGNIYGVWRDRVEDSLTEYNYSLSEDFETNQSAWVGDACAFKILSRGHRRGGEYYSAAIHKAQRGAARERLREWNELKPGDTIRIIGKTDRHYHHGLYGVVAHIGSFPELHTKRWVVWARWRQTLEEAHDAFLSMTETDQRPLGLGGCLDGLDGRHYRFEIISHRPPGPGVVYAAIHERQKKAVMPLIDSPLVEVWDNGGTTGDRYTVIIGESVFGMSENALMPNGFNMWYGDLKDLPGARDGCTKVEKFDLLPVSVRIAISRRLETYMMEDEESYCAIHERQRAAALDLADWERIRPGDLVELLEPENYISEPFAVIVAKGDYENPKHPVPDALWGMWRESKLAAMRDFLMATPRELTSSSKGGLLEYYHGANHKFTIITRGIAQMCAPREPLRNGLANDLAYSAAIHSKQRNALKEIEKIEALGICAICASYLNDSTPATTRCADCGYCHCNEHGRTCEHCETSYCQDCLGDTKMVQCNTCAKYLCDNCRRSWADDADKGIYYCPACFPSSNVSYSAVHTKQRLALMPVISPKVPEFCYYCGIRITGYDYQCIICNRGLCERCFKAGHAEHCANCGEVVCDNCLHTCAFCISSFCQDCWKGHDVVACKDRGASYSAAVHKKQRDAVGPRAIDFDDIRVGDLLYGEYGDKGEFSTPPSMWYIVVTMTGSDDDGYWFYGGFGLSPESAGLDASKWVFDTDPPHHYQIDWRKVVLITRGGQKYAAAVHGRQRNAISPKPRYPRGVTAWKDLPRWYTKLVERQAYDDSSNLEEKLRASTFSVTYSLHYCKKCDRLFAWTYISVSGPRGLHVGTYSGLDKHSGYGSPVCPYCEGADNRQGDVTETENDIDPSGPEFALVVAEQLEVLRGKQGYAAAIHDKQRDALLPIPHETERGNFVTGDNWVRYDRADWKGKHYDSDTFYRWTDPDFPHNDQTQVAVDEAIAAEGNDKNWPHYLNYSEAEYRFTCDGFIVYEMFGKKHCDCMPGALLGRISVEDLEADTTTAYGAAVHERQKGALIPMYPQGKTAWKNLPKWYTGPGGHRAYADTFYTEENIRASVFMVTYSLHKCRKCNELFIWTYISVGGPLGSGEGELTGADKHDIHQGPVCPFCGGSYNYGITTKIEDDIDPNTEAAAFCISRQRKALTGVKSYAAAIHERQRDAALPTSERWHGRRLVFYDEETYDTNTCTRCGEEITIGGFNTRRSSIEPKYWIDDWAPHPQGGDDCLEGHIFTRCYACRTRYRETWTFYGKWRTTSGVNIPITDIQHPIRQSYVEIENTTKRYAAEPDIYRRAAYIMGTGTAMTVIGAYMMQMK